MNAMKDNEKACADCGATILRKAVICPKCGCAQAALATTPTAPAGMVLSRSGAPVSKTSAALMAIFLGGFGAHRFYMGQTGKGLFYLFCPGAGLCSFFEGLHMLALSNADFERKYVNG